MSGSAVYYKALQDVFGLQAKILTRALPHAGKRGANDEERCRALLATVLPRRYGLSSGFIVSSQPEAVASPEQDLVIIDDFLNSPLYRELAAAVFPVEMVYGTVEVKGRLRSKDLDLTFDSIAAVRRLAFECFYEFPRRPQSPGRWKLEKSQIKRPPRSFIFAFDTSYKSAESLRRALERRLSEPDCGAHLHGIVVLSKNWFAFQRARKKDQPAEIIMFKDHALLRFVNNMLASLKGVVVREAEMSRYLAIPTVDEEEVEI